MAHIRTAHPVALYIANKSKPETNVDRLVTLTWKSNEKKGREAHSSRCFSVPVWQPSLSGIDSHYLPMLVDAFETLQESIAHKYVSDILNKGQNCLEIPAYLLEPGAVLATFEESQENKRNGSKLSKEGIKAWFHNTMHDILIANIAEKRGWLSDNHTMTNDERTKLNQAAAQYCALLEKLAAPSPDVNVDTAKALQKAIDVLPNELKTTDVTALKLSTRLDNIINPKATKITEHNFADML